MGPLKGIRVLEMAGIGPGPFCAMMLSDMGAEVIRIDRRSLKGTGSRQHILNRGRRSLALDLKKPEAIETVLTMIETADVIIEGFRPGVMERLGLSPQTCLARNKKLIFGRMTGWGQTGPMAQAAGHDINYISLAGALHSMGDADRAPTPPLNLVGDFGGGAMYLLSGILAALIERNTSGQGQVIDAAMTDGTASLMSPIYGLKAMDMWTNQRADNKLDGGAHFYSSYTCSDGKFISIGSIEPQFYALLLDKCGIDDPEFLAQQDQSKWPELKQKLSALFKTKTRAHWCELMENTDVCFAPILDMDEAPQHPHNIARETFVEVEGVTQPAPAPRFSRSTTAIQSGPAIVGEHNEAVLQDWGFSAQQIDALSSAEAI
ncbi:MAG: carnitine dehydratase [SAR86 cluster bacterium]|uniref:Carnitine dehydratase n=1 Tax=SAR86 cluster bacterium TaxID=2030880 RepID=A0A2A4MNY7_9GAMM|nr:MAG: carnitine dehydratase [SAR86 cluster bacterium]